MNTRILSMVFTVAAATCAVADDFEIAWHTIDSGGVMRSTGGDFELSGTIGQPDAGALAGSGFRLNGGFWFEIAPGDCNEDGITNLLDHDLFTQCLSGPDGGVLTGCQCFDVDGSGAVDLRDFASAQSTHVGS